MEGTRLRGAGRLCRERLESFLAPREGNALSNLLRNDQMRRGGSRSGPEANALSHCAVESRRAASDKAPARARRSLWGWVSSCLASLRQHAPPRRPSLRLPCAAVSHAFVQ